MLFFSFTRINQLIIFFGKIEIEASGSELQNFKIRYIYMWRIQYTTLTIKHIRPFITFTVVVQYCNNKIQSTMVCAWCNWSAALLSERREREKSVKINPVKIKDINWISRTCDHHPIWPILTTILFYFFFILFFCLHIQYFLVANERRGYHINIFLFHRLTKEA